MRSLNLKSPGVAPDMSVRVQTIDVSSGNSRVSSAIQAQRINTIAVKIAEENLRKTLIKNDKYNFAYVKEWQERYKKNNEKRLSLKDQIEIEKKLRDELTNR